MTDGEVPRVRDGGGETGCRSGYDDYFGGGGGVGGGLGWEGGWPRGMDWGAGTANFPVDAERRWPHDRLPGDK